MNDECIVVKSPLAKEWKRGTYYNKKEGITVITHPTHPIHQPCNVGFK